MRDRGTSTTLDDLACQICSHPLAEHSLLNGCCLHQHQSGGICQCGRDLAFMHRRMRTLAHEARTEQQAAA